MVLCIFDVLVLMKLSDAPTTKQMQIAHGRHHTPAYARHQIKRPCSNREVSMPLSLSGYTCGITWDLCDRTNATSPQVYPPYGNGIAA
jgi:hypothetical protein